MNDEDNLRDKYERLCSQFDKVGLFARLFYLFFFNLQLRNKYRIDKEDYAVKLYLFLVLFNYIKIYSIFFQHQIKKKDLKIQILKKEIDELKVGDGRSQSCKAMVDGSLMIPNDCNLAIQQVSY